MPHDLLSNIGNLLLTARKITPEALQSALWQQAQDPKRHLGSIFVEMGSLTPTDLVKYLVRQATLRGESVDAIALGKQILAMVSLRHYRTHEKQKALREAIAGVIPPLQLVNGSAVSK